MTTTAHNHRLDALRERHRTGPSNDTTNLNKPMLPTRPTIPQVAQALRTLEASWYRRSRRARQRQWNSFVDQQPALSHLDPHRLSLQVDNETDIAATIALLGLAKTEPDALTVLVVATLPYWMTVCTRLRIDLTALALAIQGFDAGLPGLTQRPLLVLASAARRESARESNRVLVRTESHSLSTTGWTALGKPKRRAGAAPAPSNPRIGWMQDSNRPSVEDEALLSSAATEVLEGLGPFLPQLHYDAVAELVSESASITPRPPEDAPVATHTTRRRRRQLGQTIANRHGLHDSRSSQAMTEVA